MEPFTQSRTCPGTVRALFLPAQRAGSPYPLMRARGDKAGRGVPAGPRQETRAGGFGWTLRHLLPLALGLLLALPSLALDISGYFSPRNHERPLRPRTDYIILHTTEGSEKGSLSKLLANGEAHYMVGLDGHVDRKSVV